MSKIWPGPKYGEGKAAITIYRFVDNQLIRTFKRKVLDLAEWNAQESQVIDPILGLMDQLETIKLKVILELLMPSDKGPM